MAHENKVREIVTSTLWTIMYVVVSYLLGKYHAYAKVNVWKKIKKIDEFQYQPPHKWEKVGIIKECLQWYFQQQYFSSS